MATLQLGFFMACSFCFTILKGLPHTIPWRHSKMGMPNPVMHSFLLSIFFSFPKSLRNRP